MSLLLNGLFLISLWVSSNVFAIVYSSFLGEILVGILFGGILNAFDPETYSSLGEIGLLLLVFEAGFSVNIEALKKVAIQSLIVAVLGTIFPILLGIAVLQILRFDILPSVVSSLSLASTSIGITTILLQQRNLLDSSLGTLITAAAMLDDVLSLILLSIASNLQHISAMSIILPLVASIGTMLIGALLAFALHKLLPILREKTTENRFQTALLLFMILYGFAASLIAQLIGTSPLLGVFMAGTAFINNETATSVWESHVSTCRTWLLSLFFASVGFIIPITSLLSLFGVLYGLFYAIAAFIGKMATAVCVKPMSDGLVLGTAMVGRGEVGILMAMQSLQSAIISEEIFVITIWAVLLNTIVSPYLFGYALKKKMEKEAENVVEENPSEMVPLEE